MKREEIFEYVKKQYGTIPEYLWKSSPENAILRHKNGKWYAAILRVEKSKLGLEEEGTVDIINVKCEPDMVGLLTQTYGFLPGYHMNKKYWITMLLDGSVSEAKILDFLDMSYDLIDGKKIEIRGSVTNLTLEVFYYGQERTDHPIMVFYVAGKERFGNG
ncbi:MmcQ/YjbR family DNA-binding protein [Eubacterium ramulus]|uniref:MmcQ/YjbR family DNA-binding protein n=1 Tax=Eubacterium ramulus TaxID=39490 RepID=UPI003991A5F2